MYDIWLYKEYYIMLGVVAQIQKLILHEKNTRDTVLQYGLGW